MTTTISILGCGWLGLPLGKFLVERGFSVKGSTTNSSRIGEISQNGIKGFEIRVDPQINGNKSEEFFDTDILYINIPPERRDDIVNYHKLQISNLIDQIIRSGIKKVIFASSTSVYPADNKIVDENSSLIPDKNSGKALLEVEKLLREEKGFKTTILRFAGLIGYDRSPLNSIRKKKLVLNPDVKLNLIHQDDCINISYEVIMKNKWGEVLNACSDKHPTRREYYTKEAKAHGINLPEFDERTDSKYKIVDNRKLKKVLGYSFIYPDPLKINCVNL